MDRLLELLREDARRPVEKLADMLGETVEAVAKKIDDYEKAGVIRGYRTLVNGDLVDDDSVCAVIELRVRPQEDGGFDRIAGRIAKFDQVESLHLVSGGFDLLLFVHGRNLQEVARFVSSKLATVKEVVGTATHFMLKTYKEQGVLMEGGDDNGERLQVTP